MNITLTIDPPKVESALFASNDKTVVLFCSNARQYAFAIESGRLKSSFGPTRDSQYMLGPDRDIRQLMHFLPDNRFLSPGLSQENRNVLYVRNFSSAETMAVMNKHTGPIELVATNEDMSLGVSVSMSAEVELYVWDLVKNKSLSRYVLPKLCKAAFFCGNHDDLILTDIGSVIHLLYIGTKTSPLEQAIVLDTFTINDTILFIELVPNHNLVVAASADNAITIWDLKEVADKAHDQLNAHGKNIHNAMNDKFTAMSKRPCKPGEGSIKTTATARYSTH